MPAQTPPAPPKVYPKTTADSTGVEPALNNDKSTPGLLRQRIGTQLEVHDLAGLALAAFDVSRGAVGEGGPQALTLPTRARIVDASVHALGKIADRVRNAQNRPLAVHQSSKPVAFIGGGDRNVLAETQGVVLVDPVVIGRFRARTRLPLHGVDFRSGHLIEVPAFRTDVLRVCRCRTVQLALAESAIEAREVSARQHRPNDAVAGNVVAARSEAL